MLHIFALQQSICRFYYYQNNQSLSQVMTNKLLRQQNMHQRVLKNQPLTATGQISNALKTLNSNTLWKNSSAKLNKSIITTKVSNQKNIKKNLMTQEDLQKLFCKSKSKHKIQGPVNNNWGNRNTKDFANSVKFLKVSDDWDKLLSGIPDKQSQEIDLIQSLFGKENQDLTIQFKKDYLVGKIVGQGAYASVRVAIYKPLNIKVAIKVYEKSKIQQIQRKKSVRRQIKIMQMLNHPHIVQIIDVVETNHHLNLIMQYLSGISLNSYLKTQSNGRATQKNARKVIKSLAQALKYLHSKQISHRDIKLQNVIINDQLCPKFIDFGFSTCIQSSKKVKLFCGTPSYMAPEIVQKRQYKGEPADIWALGVLSFIVLTGGFPFKGPTDQQLYKKINNADYSKVQLTYSKDLLDLMSKMLKVNPQQRITASQILKHPWIYQGNVINMTKKTKRLQTSCEYRKKTTTSSHKSRQKEQNQSYLRKLTQTYKENLKLQLRVCRNSNQKFNKTTYAQRKTNKDANKLCANQKSTINIYSNNKQKQFLSKTASKVLDLIKIDGKKTTQQKSKSKNRRF